MHPSQRRREEDFLRTVGNYRTTVATLNQEKQALLDLHQGGEGEKSELIAASQNALERASQLVSDAAAVRKREAMAVLDSIDKDVYKNLAFRLESLLPQNVVGLEISAIKGELLASKIINRGSKTLESLSSSLKGATRPALVVNEGITTSGSLTTSISEEVQQKVVAVLYQAEFAHAVADASSGLIRILSASMWPDLLSLESSANVASILGHSVDELDSVFGDVLRSIKEEGDLSPEHANFGALKQTWNATMQNILADLETLVPPAWNPPGLELMRSASSAKFASQGVAAAVSLVMNELGEAQLRSGFALFYNKLEKASTQAHMACLRLCSLDIKHESLVEELTKLAGSWESSALALLVAAKAGLVTGGDFGPLQIATDSMIQSLNQFSASLRAASLVPPDGEDRYHPLSPEVDHSWARLANLCRLVRSLDGDEDDVNYLVRSRNIEQQLVEALEKEAQLALASSRVVTLEKTLATKSKELMMQTARLSELEKEIAKGNTHGNHTIDLKASDEFARLTEENRVLHDAMQHWQSKADEYELALSDMKSPVTKATKSKTPRRGLSSLPDLAPYGATVVDIKQEDVGVLEATLFRPALQHAFRDASKWKAAAIGSHLQSLPPLPVLSQKRPSENGGKCDSLLYLTAALAKCRLVKASSTIIDLTNMEKSPKIQLREMHMQQALATEQLYSIAARCNVVV